MQYILWFTFQLVITLLQKSLGWKSSVYKIFHNKLQNGSDHAVVASYSGLYEECDVEHINVWSFAFVSFSAMIRMSSI